ncbi:hypothetical protein F7725_027203 [Dissostichus mawsoni]|uniref:WD repeat-containing protein 18 n=1 Tax=Dissostichus mawsoni TaxID=36200 RepID=A0A7J5XC97_DISMA|nr:hypothetical protein F7725_027203 [Dissostichus mawsoni]
MPPPVSTHQSTLSDSYRLYRTLLIARRLHQRSIMAAPLEVIVSSDSGSQMWNSTVFDLLSGSSLLSYRGGSSSARGLTLLSGGYLLCAQLGKNFINVWEIQRKVSTGKLLSVLNRHLSGRHVSEVHRRQQPLHFWRKRQHGSGVESVQARVATASLDQTVKVWELSSGELLLSVLFDVEIMSVIFDPSEYFLFCGAATGTSSRSHSAARNLVTCLSVSMDGTLLLSGHMTRRFDSGTSRASRASAPSHTKSSGRPSAEVQPTPAASEGGGASEVCVRPALYTQEVELTYMQKADRLNLLMNAVTDKSVFGDGENTKEVQTLKKVNKDLYEFTASCSPNPHKNTHTHTHTPHNRLTHLYTHPEMKEQMSSPGASSGDRKNHQALLGERGPSGPIWQPGGNKYSRLDSQLQNANSQCIEEQQGQQQLIADQQDEQLELVSGTIGVLKNMSERIGMELDEQMLDDFTHEVDNTHSRLDSVMKKLAKVSHMTSAGEELHQRVGDPEEGVITCLTASPDGLFLAAGVAEGIYLWEVSTGKLLSVLNRHYQDVTCLKFTDDSSHFISGGKDNMALVWELSSGELLLSVLFDVEIITSCSVEAATGTSSRSHSAARNLVTCLSVSMDGTLLLSGSHDETVRLWDIQSKQSIRSLAHKGPVTNAVIMAAPANMFLPDSRPAVPLPRFSRHLQASEGGGASEVCVRPALYTQEVELTYMQKADRLNLLMNAVTDKSVFGDGENTKVRVSELEEVQTLKKVNKDLYEFTSQLLTKPT